MTHKHLSDIETAVSQLKSTRPAYIAMLDFYGQVFIAQAASIPKPEHIRISDAELLAKKKKGLPLIDKTEFQIDINSAKNLLEVLCDAAAYSGGFAADTRPLKNAVAAGDLDAEVLFYAAISDQDDPFADAVCLTGLETAVIEFFAYNSIKPSLTTCREALAACHLDRSERWDKGYCPVCGGLPVLSLLSKDAGERRLFCAICWHDWPVPRMRCPYCGQDAPKHHSYLHADQEPEYRIDLCDACKTYIKTVDLRQLPRPFHPPLEALASIHLDMTAQEKGYQSSLSPDIGE